MGANGCSQAPAPLQLRTLGDKVYHVANLERGRDPMEVLYILRQDPIVEMAEADFPVSNVPDPPHDHTRRGGGGYELHLPKLDSISALHGDPFGGRSQ